MRKWIAGLLLIAVGIGLGLLASGRGPALAAAGLVGGAGVAVLVGRPWGRWLGLAVSGLGLAFMVFVASQANVAQGRELAEQFFADAEGHFAWYNVAIEAVAFAIGFMLCGVLLLSPFAPPSGRGAQSQ